MHIVLALTDHGTPRLTRYRRVIVNVVRAGWACPQPAPAARAQRRDRMAAGAGGGIGGR